MALKKLNSHIIVLARKKNEIEALHKKSLPHPLLLQRFLKRLKMPCYLKVFLKNETLPLQNTNAIKTILAKYKTKLETSRYNNFKKGNFY